MLCECHGLSLIEVKCPFSHRDHTIRDAILADKSFCLEEGKENTFTLKRSHMYYDQCQVQMYVCGANRLLFGVWTPKDFVCVPVFADQNWVDVNIPKFKLFALNVVIPELLSKYWTVGRYRLPKVAAEEVVSMEVDQENHLVIRNERSPDNDSNSHFPCICNGQLNVDNEMISCADKECYGKKFHRCCLNLEGKRVTVKWRCDMCVKKSKKRKPLATIN